MIRVNNKRAQIFTIAAIAVIILFFAGYEIYSFYHERIAIKRRVSTMDNFLYSLETNLEREIYISGFRIVFLAQERITKTGNYIPDVNGLFQEAFFNGSVSGNSSDILIGTRYQDIIDFVNEKADSVNVDVEMNNPELHVSQQDPWNLALEFSFNLTMRDKGNLAVWNKNEKIISLIDIEGFEDPLCIINTNGKVAYKINRTIAIDLQSHVANRYYSENSDAPSFLNRLSGNLNADENGIESLVNLDELAKQGIATQQKSVVDHIYFSSSNPASYSIVGMPSWFRLDDAHLARYNAVKA